MYYLATESTLWVVGGEHPVYPPDLCFTSSSKLSADSLPLFLGNQLWGFQVSRMVMTVMSAALMLMASVLVVIRAGKQIQSMGMVKSPPDPSSWLPLAIAFFFFYFMDLYLY